MRPWADVGYILFKLLYVFEFYSRGFLLWGGEFSSRPFICWPHEKLLESALSGEGLVRSIFISNKNWLCLLKFEPSGSLFKVIIIISAESNCTLANQEINYISRAGGRQNGGKIQVKTRPFLFTTFLGWGKGRMKIWKVHGVWINHGDVNLLK